MNIGKNIRDIRISLGKTQKDLADILATSQSTIGKYEREELEPNLHIIVKMADVFNCSVDYILGRESEDGAILVNSNDTYTSEEQNLIKQFRKLSKRQQISVLGIISELAS